MTERTRKLLEEKRAEGRRIAEEEARRQEILENGEIVWNENDHTLALLSVANFLLNDIKKSLKN